MDRVSEVRLTRGSVLIIVLVTLMFATVALYAFIEKASNDLLVEVRAADAMHLRTEAYSALETTLAVLEDFRLVGGALRSPAEGWADPLEWAGYIPAEGREVTVTFEDESGKLPLPNADYPTLVRLFESWGLLQADAGRLADALLGWMQPDYQAASADAPRPEDYERAALPFAPPKRSLRSFSELTAIDLIREEFFDEHGNPNDLWREFTGSVSLFNYRQPNINSARPAVLHAQAGYDETQQGQLADYLNGTGTYSYQGAGYFRRANEVATVLGAQSVPTGFGAEIHALRITVSVREGLASFRLHAVVAPAGGARIVAAVKTEAEQTAEASATPAPTANPAPAAGAAQAVSINYPYTILEIRENDAMPMVSPDFDPSL